MSMDPAATLGFCCSAPPFAGFDAAPWGRSKEIDSQQEQRLELAVARSMEKLAQDRHRLLSELDGLVENSKISKEPSSQDPSPFDGSFRVFDGQEPLILDKDAPSPADPLSLAVACDAPKLSQPLPERAFSASAIRAAEILSKTPPSTPL